MHPAPPCPSMGPQCHAIEVTIRVASLGETPDSADHECTWLLGHTDRMSFRNFCRRLDDLYVDATLHVRCRFLKGAPTVSNPNATRCSAHGYAADPGPAERADAQPRRLGGDRFLVVTGGELAEAILPLPARSLPVVEDDFDQINPCSIAPCTTADHKRGAACCRDLQIQMMCPEDDTAKEALIRSRLSPYLCKLTREGPHAIDGEVISACGFLDDTGLNCSLHGRSRPDGRPAKPDLCSEWPENGKGAHPGCIFL